MHYGLTPKKLSPPFHPARHARSAAWSRVTALRAVSRNHHPCRWCGWRLGDPPPRHCCCKTMQFQTNLRDKYFATRSGSWLSEPSDLHRQDWKHSYGVIMTRESSRDSNTLQLYTLPNSAIHHPFFAEIHTSPLAMVYSIGRVFDRMLSVVSMLSYFMAAPE